MFRKLSLGILSVLALSGVAHGQGQNSVIGPDVTVQTDGTKATGQVNISTQNAGPIRFWTNNALRGDIAGTTWALTGFTVAGLVLGADTVVSTLTSLTDVVLQLDNDADRLLTFGADSDDSFNITYGTADTATPFLQIVTAQADGDDTGGLCFAAGGSCSDTRGAFVNLSGNDEGGAGAAGYALLSTGNGATADLFLVAKDDILLGDLSQNASITIDTATKVSTFGGQLASATALVARVDADAQRLFTLDASSDTALTQTFGDGGTTASQVYTLSASTADADDDGETHIAGGGGVGASGSRGGYVSVKGNENGSAGDAQLVSGAASGSDVTVFAWATDGRFIIGTNGANRWMVESDGDLAGQAGGGDILIPTTGKTLAVDSGTAASACKGTVTANGTTAVTVSTTCAATGAIIFTQRTAAVAGAVTEPGCWTTNIVNGTSFDFDCNDAAENSTFGWFILKEG
jgi:hypothetical protein